MRAVTGHLAATCYQSKEQRVCREGDLKLLVHP